MSLTGSTFHPSLTAGAERNPAFGRAWITAVRGAAIRGGALQIVVFMVKTLKGSLPSGSARFSLRFETFELAASSQTAFLNLM